jgi:hypothetical protein
MDDLDMLRKRIRQHMNDMADAVSTGDAKDFPEYKRMVGVIEGLAFAEREVLDLLDKLQD